MIDYLIECILFLIPRYITDRVALVQGDNGEWTVFCLECQVEESEKLMIDSYGTIKTFTWLGFAAGGWVKLDKAKL